MAVALAACGDGGGHPGELEDSLQGTAQRLLSAVFQVGSDMQQTLPALLVPPLAASKGIVFAPDPAPNAPPNSFMVHLPVDGDGDGTADAVFDATVTLNGSLFTFGPGFGGTVNGTMVVDGAAQTLTGTITFAIVNGALEISGSGTLAEAASGTSVDFDIDPASPLRLTIANGTTALANLCEFSAEGPVQIDAEGPDGSFSALWTFAFGSTSVAVTQASTTDDEGTTPEPDSTFAVPCPRGSIQDWAGTYDFNWFCNPEEDGDSEMIVTVTGPNTIHIQDDPDDDLEYNATAVPGNPHIVRGFFVTNGYREDFVWTLSADKKTFTQQSVYVFQPPLVGGGFCGGTGTRR